MYKYIYSGFPPTSGLVKEASLPKNNHCHALSQTNSDLPKRNFRSRVVRGRQCEFHVMEYVNTCCAHPSKMAPPDTSRSTSTRLGAWRLLKLGPSHVNSA